jgi:hypothetical protein
MAKIGSSPAWPPDWDYELAADITISNWTPIGGTTPFTGSFNGDNHTITLGGLSAVIMSTTDPDGNPFSASVSGLFAHTTGAVIENLKVNLSGNISVTLSGEGNEKAAGVVVGWGGDNTQIKNVAVSGGGFTVTGEGLQVEAGGIIGALRVGSALLSGCSSSINISFVLTGNSSEEGSAGGLIGVNSGGTVENCYATGNVSVEYTGSASISTIHGGGIAGVIQEEASTGGPAVIKKSYSTGTVNAVSTCAAAQAGGITANAHNRSEITDCYSTGSVTAQGVSTPSGSTRAGGIAGNISVQSSKSFTITRCYARGNVSATCNNTNFTELGGILGNGYLNPGGTGTVKDCAALNGSVTYTATNGMIGRVVGSFDDGTLTNNIANSAMSLTGSPSIANNANDKNGADVSLPVTQTTFQNTLHWDFTNTWKMQGGYPVLQWQQ